MNYELRNIVFKLPKSVKIINNLPNKFVEKIDTKYIANIIRLSLIKQLGRVINFTNKKIILVIEDIARPTYLGKVVKIIIEELVSLGAKKSSITIISASGAHRPMNKIDFEKKIGHELASEIRCISNNCESDNFVYMGKIFGEIPLYINKFVAEADFKITISTVFPHDMAGFSGGAKIILPGVANLKSIVELHRVNKDIFAYGGIEIPEARRIIEEAGNIVGINLSVNLIINEDLEIVRLHAKDFITSQREASMEFFKIYGITNYQRTDVVISNCYPLGLDLYQVEKGLFPALFFAKENSKILFFSSCEEGVGFHRVVGHRGALREFAKSYFTKLAKHYDISFFSTGVKKSQFHEYFPCFDFVNNIDDCCSYLFDKQGIGKTSLSLLRASPLIVAK